MGNGRIHLRPSEAAEHGWLNKGQLKAIGLMPGDETPVAGTVWQGQGWYAVFYPEACVPWQRLPGPAQKRRMECAERAKNLLAGDPVILDLETTGLGPSAEIVEIGAVDANGRVLMESLVCPVGAIEQGATEVHGLSWKDVRTAPTWEGLASDFSSLVQNRLVVAYNVAFELRLLKQTASLVGVESPVIGSSQCVMALFSRWNGEQRPSGGFQWISLADAAAMCRVRSERPHRALSDCLDTLEVLKYMAKRSGGQR